MKAHCPIGAMPLQIAAKELAARGVATGGRRIFKQLREIGMLRGLHPTMHAEHMGWLVEKQGSWEYGAYARVFITTSGLDEVEFELQEKYRMQREPEITVQEYDLGIPQEPIEFGF